MIVKMKKISLLCLDSDRSQALNELRNLGVLHLKHVKVPESPDLDRLRARSSAVNRVLEILPKPKGIPETENAGAGNAAGAHPVDQAQSVLERMWAALKRRKELGELIEELRNEIRRIEPFGDFDPESVQALAASGIIVELYRAGPSQPLPELSDAITRELSRNKAGVYFTVISRKPLEIDAITVRFPEIPLEKLKKSLAQAESDLIKVNDEISAATAERPMIAGYAGALDDEIAWHEARAGMGEQGVIAYLSGFAPAESSDILRVAARKHGWGLLITEPTDDDHVPTLLRNPRWVKPIKAVFDMIGIIPGYREIDISSAFLLFLSVFFAILVGDAGYGLLFLALTWIVRRKFPGVPVHYLRLLQIMSCCTVVWGVITGVYFGLQPTSLRLLTVPWLGLDSNVMLLCFFIGAVHLTLAHAWNVARSWNSPRALAQVGWICTTWTMFFAARNMVLGHPFPVFMFWVLALGIGLIVVFMTPVKQLKHEWFNHVMLPLSLVNNFVDVVSYLRLFAVGAASLAVASSFNAMAAGLGLPLPLMALVGALILFVGHSLNILLAAMGVLVHGVRLNTLEFSSHIGMQWSGSAYQPFSRNAGQPDGDEVDAGAGS